MPAPLRIGAKALKDWSKGILQTLWQIVPSARRGTLLVRVNFYFIVGNFNKQIYATDAFL